MGITLPVSSSKLADGGFPLRALLRCPLLKYRALVDSVCVAARKEAEVGIPCTLLAARLCVVPPWGPCDVHRPSESVVTCDAEI